MNLYPLLMAPHFRHGADTPWGGQLLRDAFMKDAPEGPTGESLEISALPGQESVVANGPCAGEPLSRMIERWGEALTGPVEGGFPLLLKLLDAREPLSIQVHPDDDYARANEGKLGKSEAWVVLHAEPGARIVYGLRPGAPALREAAEAGNLEDCLNWVPVRPGDVFYIPSGMVHALGGGISCYEIQQSSDATYRLWDWGRVDAEGRPRALHTEKALAVSRPELAYGSVGGTTVLCRGGSRTYYISDAHFELCRLNVSGAMPLESGRMLFITALAPCALRWDGEALELNAFDSVLVPAALEGVVLEGDAKALMSSLPDRPALIEALGYRAENVPGLLDGR